MCFLKSCKRFLYLCFAIAAVIGLQKFCHSKTDGFTDYKIASNLSYHAQWDTQEDSIDVKNSEAILDQPFYYLAKGAQCYVFVSQDGNYVLKFFRLYHLQPPIWLSYLPLPKSLEPYREQKVHDKYEELKKDFTSYKMAFDMLKEETGLVYLHLNKTEHLKRTLTLYDKIGVLHQIDADRTEFLIQKRADLFYPTIEKMFKNGEKEQIKEVLKNLVDLIALRCKKGIFDKDPDINTNFGFFQKTPIQIDIGRFRPDETRKNPEIYCADIARITDHLRQWLEQKDPSLSAYLEDHIRSLQAPGTEETHL